MLKDILIKSETSIKDALKKLDIVATKTLLVVDDKGKLIGSLSDGDIRRYILLIGSLDADIKDVYNQNPTFLYYDSSLSESAKKIFLEKNIELIPIVDNNFIVKDYVTWNNILSETEIKKKEKPAQTLSNIPVVIMAGGKGTRLAPITKIIPKPLVPINDKPMIELIINEFRLFGVNDFYLTLNYKSEMIKSYFNSIDKDYNIHYICEDDFLGTAGSLKLLEDKIDDTFIVSNCDILVKADYSSLINFHNSSKSCLTTLSSIQHHKVPYGVIKFKNGGEIEEIQEKPEFTFTINTGVYVLNKHILAEIPSRKYFDMPSLIDKLINQNKPIYTFPVNEGNYIDFGQWEEYKQALNKLDIIK